MALALPPIVLGSRSPRRRELLGHLVGPDRIVVRPPASPDELGFEGLHDRDTIEQRLREIVREKSDDVCARTPEAESVILSADTIIVVDDPGVEDRKLVLGQPPNDDSWRDVVRGWFREHYAGRTHVAATAVRAVRGTTCREVVVRTRVSFGPVPDSLIDWYVATGEPRGKAGGYALQGAGALFVDRIEGSPSNVVGLPLRETTELLEAVGFPA